MAMPRYGFVITVGVSSWFMGCVAVPGADRIVGPDGTAMLHVHCGDEQVVCFQLAGEHCPHGYDLSPIFDAHDGNFLVRCREPEAVPRAVATRAAPTVPASRPSANSGTAADRWPPAEVATPMEPWPSPPPRTVDVDLGY